MDPFDIDGGDWDTTYLAVHPARIADTLRMPGWWHRLVVATEGERIVGLMPVSRPIGRFPADIFDPRVVAPGLADRPDAADYLLIGGHFDRASGIAVAPGQAPVRAELARTAFTQAEREGLAGVALYVDDQELGQWASLGRTAAVDEFATLSVPTDDAAYLASLAASHRSVVVRDRRALDRRGLAAVRADPDHLLDEAVDLLRDVQANHGEPEHPILVRYRLDRWLASGAGSVVAFVVRAPDGAALAVSFGRHYRDVVEMYEVGLRAGIADRVAVYAEILVYGPLRFAYAKGVTRLRLGSGSIQPKRLRGAAVSQVWAVAG